MNLRQKNKKLKRELEEARAELTRVNTLMEENYRLAKEIKDTFDRLQRIGDLTTLSVWAHTPEYAMLSEEQVKAQMVKRMIPELAKCVTFEHYVARGGVTGADYIVANIRVMKPRGLA